MKRLRPIDLTGRLLLAQAQLENLTLVSADTTLRRTGVRCLW
jgi:PIN domain nuclease of toxin-antitoxin system